MDIAVRKCDKKLRETTKQIQLVYQREISRAFKEQTSLFDKVKKIDIELNKDDLTLAERNYWNMQRSLALQKIANDDIAINEIATRLEVAGVNSRELIENASTYYYKTNREYVAKSLKEVKGFAQLNENAIKVIVDEERNVFQKVAIKDIADKKHYVKLLKQQMIIAQVNGESEQKLRARIQKTFTNSRSRAQLIARTERTRVQNQARNDTAKEAVELGAEISKTWHCRFQNSRDSHIAVSGETVAFDDTFSNGLLYPGDETAEASEVCNCNCYATYTSKYYKSRFE